MNPHATRLSANIVDVIAGRCFPGTVEVANGRISRVVEGGGPFDTCVLPGFIDAHVHVESSMLVPSEFARLAVMHGTVASVNDPHEIANVMGVEGVDFMIRSGNEVPFKFHFGAPSCVPATSFETAGAQVSVDQVRALLERDEIFYLSEMMDWPGVLNGDAEVMAKLDIAKRLGKPIDGHAPGLRGDDARRYLQVGISTDHECFTKEEAIDKLKYGAKILIREGSTCHNFDALYSLIDEYPDRCMLCCDDQHPDSLVRGHIDKLVGRALKCGVNRMKVLRAACVNPVLHYGLGVGLLREGDPADFIVIDNFDDLTVLKTFINGRLVAEAGRTLLGRVEPPTINHFLARPKSVADFAVEARGNAINVIEAIDGQVITNRVVVKPKVMDGVVVSDRASDVLKITVVNRYADAPPAVGFVKNFGLKDGAIASSVAHDSHNIIAVGVGDRDLCDAVNLVIEHRGGLAVASKGGRQALPLPIAGLMSGDDGFRVAEQYSRMNQLAAGLGATLAAPFMALSFMALLVIPQIKLSDRGLFDGDKFKVIDLFET